MELGFSISDNKDDLGEQLESFTVPLTSTANLAVDLFRATIESSVDLSEFFVQLQERVAALNTLAQDVEQKKTEISSNLVPPAAPAARGKTES